MFGVADTAIPGFAITAGCRNAGKTFLAKKVQSIFSDFTPLLCGSISSISSREFDEFDKSGTFTILDNVKITPRKGTFMFHTKKPASLLIMTGDFEQDQSSEDQGVAQRNDTLLRVELGNSDFVKQLDLDILLDQKRVMDSLTSIFSRWHWNGSPKFHVEDDQLFFSTWKFKEVALGIISQVMPTEVASYANLR